MYETHFGLTDKPFRLTPDARLFYPSDQHRRALAFLEYGLHEGEGFIVITGEPGTGKSTLVSKLMSEHARDSLKVAVIETSRLSDEHLLEMLVSRFELRVPRLGGKTSLVETLRKGFLAWEKRGVRALAIIDEAQNLPAGTVEELRMLSNLTGKNRPLLQTFLVGQPALRARIEHQEFEQLRQRITASFHLGPFQVEEIRAYVEYRLIQSGWKRNPIFSDDAYQAIHDHTGGVARLINVLCDRLLLFCYLESATRIDAEVVSTVAKETGVRPPEEAFQTQDSAAQGVHRDNARDKKMTGSDGVALVSVLIDQLRTIDSRIQSTERRLRSQMSMLHKAIQKQSELQQIEGGADTLCDQNLDNRRRSSPKS